MRRLCPPVRARTGGTIQGFVETIEDSEVLHRTAIGANRSINAAYTLPRTWGVLAGLLGLVLAGLALARRGPARLRASAR